MLETNKIILLKTSQRLFKQHGFHNTDIDEICAKTNISKTVLYQWFPTKYNLIEECLVDEDKFIRESINELTRNFNPIKNIRNIYLWHVEQIRLNQKQGLLFLKVMDEMPNYSAILLAAQQHREWKRKLLEQQLTGLKIKNSTAFSILLLNVMENLFFSLDSKVDYLQIWNLLENFLKSSIGTDD